MKENATAAPGAFARLFPVVVALSAMMAGCGTTTDQNGEPHRSLIPLPWHHKTASNQHDPNLPNLPAAGSRRGGYYQDDGPGANPPAGLLDVPDAVVKFEPYVRGGANKPYSVFGQTYTPLINDEPFVQQGVASWYGVKFNGQRTSSGEAYDMYKMTAAHPTLPIPSYARITNLSNGKSVVVRINDRGPFHSDRAVDVSYTAALKLGLLGSGSNKVQIERLFAGDEIRLASARRADASEAQAAPPEIAALMLEDRVPMDSAAVASLPVSPKEADAVAAAASASAAAAAPASAANAAAATPSGFYLQLGAFGRDGKAEEMSALLKKSGVSQALEVVHAGAINRLYCGPYETRALAQAAARALPASLGLRPIVVRR